MAYWQEEQLKTIMNNVLKSEDTFTFTCKMCGSCCRNRSEPILMSGMDVFRIAQALEIQPMEVLGKYMRGYLGDDSHVPVYVLKERLDGSCSLLRKGKCMVHSKKPVVCAIHPLGRFFSGEDHDTHYFKQDSVCPQGKQNGKVWTLKEWLDGFGILELDSMSKAWFKLMMGITTVTCKMKKEDIDPMLTYILVNGMYASYDITKRYEDQVEINMERLQHILKEKYNIDLKF